MGYSKTHTKSKVYSHKYLCQKRSKITINNLTLQLKELEEEQTELISTRKEIINIIAEINETQSRKQ